MAFAAKQLATSCSSPSSLSSLFLLRHAGFSGKAGARRFLPYSSPRGFLDPGNGSATAQGPGTSWSPRCFSSSRFSCGHKGHSTPWTTTTQRAQPQSQQQQHRGFSDSKDWEPLSEDEPQPDETVQSTVLRNSDADPTVEELIKRNEIWRDGFLALDPEAFAQINKSHEPRFLIVGCSDARVPIERVFGMRPGEAFVHRNVGNLVVGTDLNFLSVLQYAVDVLKVEHILVCGHYGCGACKSAVMPQDLGLIENWLRNIRDVHRLNHRELKELGDPSSPEFHRRLVELNVREQCINLFKTSTVQHSRTLYRFPSVHGFVYDMDTGRMIHQDTGLLDYLRRYKHIYRLYN